MASWYIPAQATPPAMALLRVAPREDWRAPYCFLHEIANLLLRQEKRGTMRAGSVEAMLLDIVRLDVSIEPPPEEHQFRSAVSLARKHGISIFDGFYLHLAQNLRATLAPRDGPLAVAAEREHSAVLDLRWTP